MYAYDIYVYIYIYTYIYTYTYRCVCIYIYINKDNPAVNLVLFRLQDEDGLYDDCLYYRNVGLSFKPTQKTHIHNDVQTNSHILNNHIMNNTTHP